MSDALPGRPATLLRVFVGNHDKRHGVSLYEVIVERAREAGLAGATVIGGFMGYGSHAVVHHATLFRPHENLPVVIEVVDEDAKIRAFLPTLQELMGGGGQVILEQVCMIDTVGGA